MRVLVTGVGGQLGFDVVDEFKKRNYFIYGTDLKPYNCLMQKPNCDEYIELDITKQEDVNYLLNKIDIEAIVHCAAWTNVDEAELEKNKPLVKRINVDGTNNLVKIAKNKDIKFVYISTDYVFNGEGIDPWKPDFNDFQPQNYYGLTKLQGEQVVSTELEKFFIVRIAWVFGKNGKNFVKTMLNLADKGYKELRVVDDQIGTPTYTYDLARLLVDMTETDKYGYYHATNEGGYISWADFAEEIFKQTNKNVIIKRVSTAEYGLSIAKRPYNSRLDKNKLVENGFRLLPDWRDALMRYLDLLIK